MFMLGTPAYYCAGKYPPIESSSFLCAPTWSLPLGANSLRLDFWGFDFLAATSQVYPVKDSCFVGLIGLIGGIDRREEGKPGVDGWNRRFPRKSALDKW